MAKQEQTPKKEAEALTLPENLPLQRVGNSDYIRFPAAWKQICKLYHINPPMLELHLEKTDGKIQIVGTLTKQPIAKDGGE